MLRCYRRHHYDYHYEDDYYCDYYCYYYYYYYYSLPAELRQPDIELGEF